MSRRGARLLPSCPKHRGFGGARPRPVRPGAARSDLSPSVSENHAPIPILPPPYEGAPAPIVQSGIYGRFESDAGRQPMGDFTAMAKKAKQKIRPLHDRLIVKREERSARRRAGS